MPDDPRPVTPPRSASSIASAILFNTALLGLVLLLAASTYLVYRLAALVGQVEATLVAVSDDIDQVAETAGQVSSDISGIRTEVRELLERAREKSPIDEAEHAIATAEAVKLAMRNDESQLSETDKDEIGALLEAVARSDCRAIVGDGDDESAVWLSSKLGMRYLWLRKGLKSTEDFIDQVATESTFGNEYHLVDKAGRKMPLNAWMHGRLAQMREAEAEAAK
jgi:hypothetical protein